MNEVGNPEETFDVPINFILNWSLQKRESKNSVEPRQKSKYVDF
jgi:hypothetical protein